MCSELLHLRDFTSPDHSERRYYYSLRPTMTTMTDRTGTERTLVLNRYRS